MTYLLIGCAMLAVLVGVGRMQRLALRRREWRIVAAALAVAAFVGAAFVGLRGEWSRTFLLVLLGLWLASTTRVSTPAPARPLQPDREDIVAREVLGVGPQATPQEIRRAYARLMRSAHPDAGGAHGRAAQINAARDLLLRKPSPSRG